jgi:maltose alpha-D-glucosyltransferase / alpha-amylase
VSDAFVTAYRGALDGTTMLPPDEAWPVLARAFVLDQAISELARELSIRPDFVTIPLRGILKLI